MFQYGSFLVRMQFLKQRKLVAYFEKKREIKKNYFNLLIDESPSFFFLQRIRKFEKLKCVQFKFNTKNVSPGKAAFIF